MSNYQAKVIAGNAKEGENFKISSSGNVQHIRFLNCVAVMYDFKNKSRLIFPLREERFDFLYELNDEITEFIVVKKVGEDYKDRKTRFLWLNKQMKEHSFVVQIQ